MGWVKNEAGFSWAFVWDRGNQGIFAF